jgi:hypothetical protein
MALKRSMSSPYLKAIWMVMVMGTFTEVGL